MNSVPLTFDPDKSVRLHLERRTGSFPSASDEYRPCECRL